MSFTRSSGILLHPTSLPGKYGIGTLGREAYDFIDFLVKANQKLWQICPLGPTGYGNSPYSCFSAFAGNPLLISLETLAEQGFLLEQDYKYGLSEKVSDIDFSQVIKGKYPLLKEAFENFQSTATNLQKRELAEFRSDNSYWLEEYSLFMALKHENEEKPWFDWAEPLRMHQPAAVTSARNRLEPEIEFHIFLQFVFFNQWLKLKGYANSHGVNIIGDIPLYVAHDSVDAWSNHQYFLYDRNRNPELVGGVPPDYFSETGQLWGNPIYNWKKQEKGGYSWWLKRIQFNLKCYDIVRIDHFRGFSQYWAVPFGEKTAIRGEWCPGPGEKLFQVLKEKFGPLPIIAEDLGFITEDVLKLRDKFNLPGMKILQFAFDSEEGSGDEFLPHNYDKNCVVYTGTHDNDTVLGWYAAAREKDRHYASDYLNIPAEDRHFHKKKWKKTLPWSFIRAAWASTAVFAITPLQDVLGLENEARMNLPGTSEGNWLWRYREKDLTDELAGRLMEITRIYQR